jgi:pimeloyl-ACP methyl ester carboxylesterase
LRAFFAQAGASSDEPQVRNFETHGDQPVHTIDHVVIAVVREISLERIGRLARPAAAERVGNVGSSLGCMHSFMWAEMYPELMDGIVGLSCQPVEISGRNWIMRRFTPAPMRLLIVSRRKAWRGGP